MKLDAAPTRLAALLALLLVSAGCPDGGGGIDDPDADTFATAVDCAPSDPLRWRQVDYAFVDMDGDGFHGGGGGSVCVGATVAPQFVLVSLGPDCDDGDPGRYIDHDYRFIDDDGDGYTRDEVGTVCAGAVRPARYETFSFGPDCDETDLTRHTLHAYAHTDLDADRRSAAATGEVCGGLIRPAGYLAEPLTFTDDCDDLDPARWQSLAYTFRDADGDGVTIREPGFVCSGATLPDGYRVTQIGLDCDDDDASVRDFVLANSDMDGDGAGDRSARTICHRTGATLPDGYVGNGCDAEDEASEVGCFVERAETLGNNFDFPLSVSEDRWALGIPRADWSVFSNSGQIRIYRDDPREREPDADQIFTVVQAPTPRTGQLFGTQVELLDDGLFAMAKSADVACGACYEILYFERSSERWFFRQTFRASLFGDEAIFFDRMEVKDGRLVVYGTRAGFNVLFVFEDNGSGAYLPKTWIVLDELHGGVARDFAVSGETIAVSGRRSIETSPGVFQLVPRVQIYDRVDTLIWRPTGVITAEDRSFAAFGTSIDLDGDRLLVGDPSGEAPLSVTGSATLYERQPDDRWDRVQELSIRIGQDLTSASGFGTRVEIEGDRIVVAAPSAEGVATWRNHGRIEIFARRDSGVWERVTWLSRMQDLSTNAYIGRDGLAFDHGRAAFVAFDYSTRQLVYTVDIPEATPERRSDEP